MIGLCFNIVTSTRTSDECSERIDKFLTDWRQDLVDMKQEDFNDHVNSLAKSSLEAFNDLSELTSHYWCEVKDRRYCYDVCREEVLQLKAVTKEKVLEGFDRWFYPLKGEGGKEGENVNRRRLSVHIVGAQAVENKEKEVDGMNVDDDTIDSNENAEVNIIRTACNHTYLGVKYPHQ